MFKTKLKDVGRNEENVLQEILGWPK